jgi:uncharacterized protein YggE
MMRFRWILLLAGVLLLASAVAGVAQPHFGHAAGTTATKTITVTGNGSVTTVPDQAGFDFTVETKAATAKAALAQNSTAAAAVVAAVKNAGVADADIQTSQVSNSISVKSTISKAGSIVDAAVAAGADGVSGPSLSLSDQDVQYRDALKLAVAAAHAKAQTLADAGGLSLGGVQTIVEGAAQYPVPLAGKADFSAGVVIQPGTQTVDATVTVTYNAS